jgi:hypothetical protein
MWRMVRRAERGETRWWLAAACAVLVAAATWALPGEVGAASGATAAPCRLPTPGAAYEARVRSALATGRDVWGEALLAAPSGPTLAGARRHLTPLLLARGPKGARLTASGVYYLAFAQPDGPRGAGTVALHVADGSQVVAQRAGGRALTVGVGPGGRERYGSCLARLTPATLAGGYLPILRTRYVDTAGVRYRQESFVARVPETRSLVSFVRLEADARRAERAVVVRFTSSVAGLGRIGTTLGGPGRAQLAFEPGGAVSPSGVAYAVPAGTQRTISVAWLVTPAPLGDLALDDETYSAARASVGRYWEARLARAMSVDVPEPAVANALRALLVQSLVLTWRYSVGNQYEQFSFPESVDAARVLAGYGLAPVARSILRTSLTRDEERYRNWKRGERLVALADYYRLSGDRATVRQTTPTMRRWITDFSRQLGANGRSGLERQLLERERYSSDIPDRVYGLHSQAVVWEGLRAMAGVWRETGDDALAARSSALATRLGRGLRLAVAASQRRLDDGSLFVPIALLDREAPYDLLVQERLGSYWNLVMPYALASGIFPPGAPQARGVLRYLELHGSRLLGIVRAGGYSLYGRDAFPASGTNHVYNLSVARFLGDNDESDQLVLALYGSLAAGLTPATFVSGEAASVAPLQGSTPRAMYLPPNGGSGAAFLGTVRELLVHEIRDRAGLPYGLRLAPATPRAWLRPGRHIAVENAPTSFGPVSYSIAAGVDAATISLETPARRPRMLSVRLRLPRGTRLGRVAIDGTTLNRVDRTTGTIDLSGATGEITIVARYEKTR